jgi:hypothetical protein
VIRKLPKANKNDIGTDIKEDVDREYWLEGYKLYSAVPLMYPTGIYRLLCTKNFAREKGVGFGIEIFFTVALLSLQMGNNAHLAASNNYN